MTNHNIANSLEIDQIEYLDTVLSQLEDNVDALSDRFGQYELTHNHDDLVSVLCEFRRLSERQEAMTSLSHTLIEETKKELNARQHIQS